MCARLFHCACVCVRRHQGGGNGAKSHKAKMKAAELASKSGQATGGGTSGMEKRGGDTQAKMAAAAAERAAKKAAKAAKGAKK